MNKKVIVGSDHGGVELKGQIKKFLESEGYNVSDMGIYSGESADYPDIAEKTCKEFLKGDYAFGILCCGTGIGISIAANKIEGIRCALIHNLFTAEMCKAHNNANFIAVGGRLTYEVPIEEMIKKYAETSFDGGGRHENRVAKITALE